LYFLAKKNMNLGKLTHHVFSIVIHPMPYVFFPP
jgi:hypothetical protein